MRYHWLVRRSMCPLSLLALMVIHASTQATIKELRDLGKKLKHKKGKKKNDKQKDKHKKKEHEDDESEKGLFSPDILDMVLIGLLLVV
ncbi:hypothetical protein Ciccas_007719 [Cichlidogyrus casuarinus]|uniref:Uncharacterized protein n=1 Tax=Cichlidogyrus casuarinus TaxID=1844966 RepID=A0ABD2Q228_9PLAT